MTDLHALRPFTARPIILNAPDAIRATHRTATCSFFYIIRQQGTDLLGQTPDYSHKRIDLIATGRAAPVRASSDGYLSHLLWQDADRHAQAHRPGEAAAYHLVGSLPVGMQAEDWRALVEDFAHERLVKRGMVADWAIHFLAETDDLPGIRPHAHFIVSTRAWDKARDPGRRVPTWLGTRRQRLDHADAWYKMSNLFPAPGFELAVD